MTSGDHACTWTATVTHTFKQHHGWCTWGVPPPSSGASRALIAFVHHPAESEFPRHGSRSIRFPFTYMCILNVSKCHMCILNVICTIMINYVHHTISAWTHALYHHISIHIYKYTCMHAITYHCKLLQTIALHYIALRYSTYIDTHLIALVHLRYIVVHDVDLCIFTCAWFTLHIIAHIHGLYVSKYIGSALHTLW